MSKNKKLTRLFFLAAAACFFFLWSEPSMAYYEDEGTAFYAQARPGDYAIEGTAFYAFTSQVDGTVPVYRSLNSSSGDHLYTRSDVEKNASGYTYEGVAFYAYATQVDGTSPVYRFFNTSTGDHFYTASAAEKSALQNNPQWGYSYEGPAFYVFISQADGTSRVYRFFNAQNGDHFYTASVEEKNSITLSPVYRFFSPINGDHFYTASEAEKSVVANTSHSDYLFEGIAFYAFRTNVSGTIPIHRSLSPITGDHFYSASATEGTAAGYSYEGVAFYAYNGRINGATDVYRLYNTSSGDHFYTVSSSEKDAVLYTGLGPDISVGLWTYSSSDLRDEPFKIDANKTYNIKNKNGTVIAQVGGSSQTRVKYDGDDYFEVYNSISSTRIKDEVQFDAADGNNNDLIMNVHRPSSDYDEYRGEIRIRHYDSSNNWVINILPLEQYIWGDGETTGTGDFDHTKVMTTIFRTYGYQYLSWTSTKYMKYGFRIRSDSGSQIYRGYEWETAHPNVKKAAQSTRGVIVTYDGDVALTPYCSYSDGRTRSWEEKWGSDDYPWCQSVSDPYGKHPTMSTSQLEAAGNHMVGLIGYGSVDRANAGWSWSRILRYYYTNISLSETY